MPPVKPTGVSAQKPFHPGDQIALRRLHHPMKMIAHQAIGLHLPIRLGASFPQRLEEAQPVGVILEDRLPAIAAIHDVIKGPGIFHSQLSGHASDDAHQGRDINTTLLGTDTLMANVNTLLYRWRQGKHSK